MDLADFDSALRVFEEENSIPDAADALWRSGIINTMYEESREEGLDKLLRSITIFRELGDVRKEIEATLNLGLAFNNSLLFDEATQKHSRVLAMGEKLDVFAEQAQASAWCSWILENKGKLADAVLKASKAWEYCQKTDVTWLPAFVLSILVRQYTKLGEMKLADESFERLEKLPHEVNSQWFNKLQVPIAKGVYLAAKGSSEEANQLFKEMLAPFELEPTLDALPRQYTARICYSWALEKQGKIEEAKTQRTKMQKLLERAEERFGYANLHMSVMTPRRVLVGEEFEMRLDLVNVSRKPGLLTKAEDVIPLDGFKVTALPSWCNLQNGNIEMKNKQIGAFQVETVKLALQAVKAGTFTLNTKAVYVDDLGETRTVNLDQKTITVQPAQQIVHVLAGRVASGYSELDDLLGGGIPENYAVVLASPSSDERSLLIKRFLEAGAEAGETTFYITAEVGNGKALAQKYPSNFYLFICNPRADATIQSLPNVIKLKGVENLTEIDIALNKAFRTLNPSAIGPKRACIEIVSDVLLQHHALVTRKWLGGLLPDLKARGFTTLAVIDPQMHPQEELQAITGLFEGEMKVYEKETNEGTEKVLRIRKLGNQKYLKNELILTTEKLDSK